jgi:hypothetical protein
MKTKLLCLFLSLTMVGVQAVAFNKAGRTAFSFVKIGIGARQTAMGEAGISLVRDVNGMFWNPAAITGVQSAEASFSYNRWFAQLDYVAGAAGIRWPGVGVLGIGYSSLGYGEINEALVQSPTGSSDTRTGETFTGGDLLVGLTYAREFTDNLSIGVTLKYLREKLFLYSSSAVAFDVGTHYDTGFKGIRFAMSFLNFSQSVKFLDQGLQREGYDLPLVFRVGACIDLVKTGDSFIDVGENHALTLAIEAVNTNDFGERYGLGGEYTFFNFLALRGGYRFNYDEGNLSLGVGVQQKIGDLTVRADYSYVSYEFLESPQRVTVSLAY